MLDGFLSERADFEFADLRHIIMKNSRFTLANFVGADLSDANATACDFHDADFYWAVIESFLHDVCNFQGARFPEKVEIACGPKDMKPPDVMPVPLYRTPATAAERKELLKAIEGLESLPDERSPKPGTKKADRKA
jgi:hypothetical protein